VPHIPKSVTHAPTRLTQTGSATRPELVGVRPPQPKAQIPVRSKPKATKAPGESFMPRINPMTYDGPETHPENVFKGLFGRSWPKENEFGVANGGRV